MSESTKGPKIHLSSATHMSVRGPEATLSGSGARPLEALPPSSHDARVTRLMLGLTVTTAGTLGFMGVVFFQVVLTLIGQAGATPAVAESAPECREGQANDCNVGMVCQAGRCVQANRTTVCQVGDPCGGEGACSCEAPLTCEQNVCTAPRREPIACDDPKIALLLQGLAETCKGNLDTCPENRLNEFAIASQDFDAVLAMFPDTFTVHFPNGGPPIERDQPPWPGAAERSYLKSKLAEPAVAKALREAREILMIGRSSQGGDENRNYRYSRRRTQLVASLIHENAATPDEQSALRAKSKQLFLGSKKLLEPDFFAKHFSNRLIAWSADDEMNLRANVTGIAKLRGDQRKWTRSVMNQVVFVVPIPCELPKAR